MAWKTVRVGRPPATIHISLKVLAADHPDIVEWCRTMPAGQMSEEVRRAIKFFLAHGGSADASIPAPIHVMPVAEVLVEPVCAPALSFSEAELAQLAALDAEM